MKAEDLSGFFLAIPENVNNRIFSPVAISMGLARRNNDLKSLENLQNYCNNDNFIMNRLDPGQSRNQNDQ
jgi:hypothetical protein